MTKFKTKTKHRILLLFSRVEIRELETRQNVNKPGFLLLTELRQNSSCNNFKINFYSNMTMPLGEGAILQFICKGFMPPSSKSTFQVLGTRKIQVSVFFSNF